MSEKKNRPGAWQASLDHKLGCSCVPNTEPAPGAESETRHEIVVFDPAQLSGTLVRLDWLLLAHVRYLFSHSLFHIKYFPFACDK